MVFKRKRYLKYGTVPTIFSTPLMLFLASRIGYKMITFGRNNTGRENIGEQIKTSEEFP